MKEQNYNAWLQGLYIYEAISVALSNAFRDKKKDKVIHYSAQPYEGVVPLTEEEKEAKKKRDLQKTVAFLDALAIMGGGKTKK